jgi:hypothetical protein
VLLTFHHLPLASMVTCPLSITAKRNSSASTSLL